MLANNQLSYITGNSPFKFLKPYERKDEDIFYGREQDVHRLKSAFNKYSFVILYGPSGSGKSSLINCGLLKGKDPNGVFEIRRGNHILKTLEKQLFSKYVTEVDFKHLIEEIHVIQLKIQVAKEDLKKSNEAIIQLETSFQRGKLTEEVLARKEQKWIDIIKEKETEIPFLVRQSLQKNKLFTQGFTTILKQIKTTPYLIFDQFEEIFISGSIEEIQEFGTFLSCIFQNKIPVKLLLSIREEYFSKLNKFEKFLPQILLRKVELDNPKIDSVREILQKSFKNFNINQVKDDGQNSISTKDKEKRIELIIEQLACQGEGVHQPSPNLYEVHFHLPFLQIYLDKLYREDVRRTYRYKDLSANSFPALEFEEHEIRDFGSLGNVLKDYIQEVNKVLFQKNAKVLADVQPGLNLVIKFLKLFITNGDTKKRIAIEKTEGVAPNQSSYYIKDERINKRIQLGIWGKYDEKKYKQVISSFINDLRKFRLIKINENFAELSHDILARVISKYPIERGIKEILRLRFSTYYEEYENKNRAAEFYLNETQIAACNNKKLLPFILQDDDPLVQKKKERYWMLSKRVAEEKRKTALLAKEWQIKKLKRKNYIIICLFLFSAGSALFLGKQYFELEHERSSANYKEQEHKIKSNIFEGTASAYNHINSDRTKAIIKIQTSEQEFQDNLSAVQNKQKAIKEDKTLYNTIAGWIGYKIEDVNANKPPLINDFTNNLYKDFYRFPFYSKELLLAEEHKSPILLMKFLPTLKEEGQLSIYFLTKEGKLFETTINYLDTKANIIYSKVADDVTAFELYYDKENNVLPLYFSNNNLLTRQSFKKIVLDSISNYRNPSFLERINDSLFITASNDTIKELRLLSTGLSISNRIELAGNTFSNVKAFDDSYMVFTERGDIYQLIKNKFQLDTAGDSYGLKAVVTTSNKKYILSAKNGLKLRTDKYFQDRINHNHEDGITSIDYINSTGEELMLLGSYDRTVSIISWNADKAKSKEKKRLIGHSDKITSSYFIDKNKGDFILTASADGTIKIWDLRPVEQLSFKVREAELITSLKQNKQDSLLYVGFLFNSKPKGYLYAFDQNLSTRTSQKIYQNRRKSDKLGHLSSFDFLEDGRLMIGGFENKLVSISDTTQNSRNIKLRFTKKPTFPVINEVAVKDSMLVVATKKGLFLIKDYIHSKKEIIDTLRNLKINSIDIHPTKNIALAAASDGGLYLWDMKTLEMEKIEAHLDEVQDAEFSESGNFFISGSKDNKAIIWKFNQQNNKYEKYGATLNVHTNNIEDVAFYKDHLVLTASTDQTVQIFQLDKTTNNFLQIPSLIKHDTKITAATFSLDGQYIYTGCKEGLIKKWAFREFDDIVAKRIPQ